MLWDFVQCLQVILVQVGDWVCVRRWGSCFICEWAGRAVCFLYLELFHVVSWFGVILDHQAFGISYWYSRRIWFHVELRKLMSISDVLFVMSAVWFVNFDELRYTICRFTLRVVLSVFCAVSLSCFLELNE